MSSRRRCGVRLASTGTSVTATHPATASAASADVLASAICPSSAAAPEYNANSKATVSAAMDSKNARTAERSALDHNCAMVEVVVGIGNQTLRDGRKFCRGAACCATVCLGVQINLPCSTRRLGPPCRPVL